MNTVRYLALPGAVVIHTLGALVSQYVISSLVAGGATVPLDLSMTVINVGTSLLEVALCIAALLVHITDLRSGRIRHPGWTVAWSALAASLMLTGLHRLVWYGGFGFDLVVNLSLAVFVIAMALAALALVSGVVAARAGAVRFGARSGSRPGIRAVALAAVATPAALLTPVIGRVVRTTAVYNVEPFVCALLAMVGFAAAVVALRLYAPVENQHPDAVPAE